MISKKDLVDLGFSQLQANALLQNKEFITRTKRKSSQEFATLFRDIQKAYGATKAQKAYGATTAQIARAITSHPQFINYNHPKIIVTITKTLGLTTAQAKKAIITYPQFAGRNHSKIARDMKKAYGATKAQIKQAILTHPAFANLDHLKSADYITKTYGATKAQTLKILVSFPQFADLNHKRVISGITKTYGVTIAQAKKAILSYPPFAGLNHARAISDITNAYGTTKAKAKQAIITFPRFAGLDHVRVFRQAMSLGHIIGLNRQEIVEAILNKPVLTSYSEMRNRAAIDAFRNAVIRSGSTKTNRELFEIYQKNFMESPYPIKGSKKSESWWQRRRTRPVQSKMGQKIQKRLIKARHPK